jgi:hypothetical protein
MPERQGSEIRSAVDQLADEFVRFKEQSESRIMQLEGEVARLQGRPPRPDVPARVDRPDSPDGRVALGRATSGPMKSGEVKQPEMSRPLSRRGALMALGGAAAGGVGLAVGSVLGAEPAGATNPALLLDQVNTATSITQLTGGLSSTLLNLFNTGQPGGVIYAQSVAASGLNGRGGVIIGDTNGTVGPGVVGLNGAGVGIYGTSVGESGLPTRSGYTAVVGDTGFGDGVLGLSGGGNGNGVIGIASGPSGIEVSETSGVKGDSNAGSGVIGLSSSSSGVDGTTSAQSGVGVFAGNLAGGASLQLSNSGTTLPAFAAPGQFIVLSNGSLYFCHADNKWVQLNRGFTNLLPTPIRVFDSRTSGAANVADPSRTAGPFAAGSIVTLQITGATVGGHAVPAGASAVIGNVTAVSPSGGGWLTLFPHGEATPLVSNLNFQAGDQARGNFCVVALDASGRMDVFAQSQTQVVFDVSGYVV